MQKIGFIKHESHEDTSAVSVFIDQYQVLLNVMEQRTYVSVVGFDTMKKNWFPCLTNSEVAISELYHETNTILS